MRFPRPFFLIIAAAVLTGAVIAQQTSQSADPPQQVIARLSLVRHDITRARSDGYAPTRQLARKRDGADAVDWPDFSHNGRPIFREGAEEQRPLAVRKGADAANPFQAKMDEVIEPGNHWFRAIDWRGRRHLYTADKTARTADASLRYELWLFPIVIEGEGAPVVKNVELKAGGKAVYRKAGPWRSLTLLLPASEHGKPYTLSIDGRAAVQFHAGLQPVKLGDPREMIFPTDVALRGAGPMIRVRSLSRPAEFPHQKEWAADIAALQQPIASAPRIERGAALARHLGVEVPRSALMIYAAALPDRTRGGFFTQKADLETDARLLSESGYDAVIDQANTLPAPHESHSFEARAAALARHGVRLGLQYDNNRNRPSLQHPNAAFFSHTLPDWHAPLYRSLQLAAQRFARLPNFLGILIGAESSGYASHTPWAPPAAVRPWGEAMIEFMQSPQPRAPRTLSLGAPERPFEVAAENAAEFFKYVNRYDTTFRQYGYFAEAVREVSPSLVFTTAAFGSARGEGGRGGWPSASLPGRVMFEGLNTQQVYDPNPPHAGKPMHNAALIDRLRSYHPEKRTWAIIDNSTHFFGREALQREYAIALTRGVQGIGASSLARIDGENGRPEVAAFQKELHGWLRKYGGVYAMTEPEPVIGIFFSHHQALLRPVVTRESPPEARLYGGSHEGKVAEALFLCHAAGWPARVITYQEVMRGPLPGAMKAILLVGLDRPAASWEWGPGIAPMLQQFIAAGGRIVADEESVCSVPVVRPGLRVAAYVAQSTVDPTPLLFARNRDNAARLRTAMEGAQQPIAASAEATVWAIPARASDTQYVTVINQGYAEGEEANEMLRPADPRATRREVWKTKANASLYVKPQTGALQWNTERPIYDVRLGRRITIEEAQTVDLTADAFRWYALPPAEVVAPEVTVERGVSGFYEARPVMENGARMNGVPVEIRVARGGKTASVFGATGGTVRLPLRGSDAPGEYQVTVKELLTGLEGRATVIVPEPTPPAAASGVRLRDPSAMAKFAARKHVALTIALTRQQSADPQMTQLASQLAGFYSSQGRIVSQALAEPNAVVESLQPLRSPHRFPQWKTIRSDLVLFGTPATNVLLLDQARGQIFPADLSASAADGPEVVYTRSPFVGEYDAVNIIGNDLEALRAAVEAISAPAKK